MKTRSQPSRHLRLRLVSYGNAYYIKRIAKLEKILAATPRVLEIELIGGGEIPADFALLFREVLSGRSSKTRLITHARSSLQGGSVLVWLLGDERRIRNDARLYFRRVDLPEEGEPVPSYNPEAALLDASSEMDPEEYDYARVLQVIDEYLPVMELAGRIILVPVLKQFGLVDNERMDSFLAGALGKSEAALAAR